MSYDERLLREYERVWRKVLLREKLKAAASIASGEGGSRAARSTGLPSYEDIKGVTRAECKPDVGACGCIAWLLGQPESFCNAINSIFGEQGLFNISALWKTDVNFLGEETLKPAWDFLMETLSMESTPRPKVGEDFWARLFGRTSSAVSTTVGPPSLTTTAPPVSVPATPPPLPAGTSLADRIAANSDHNRVCDADI